MTVTTRSRTNSGRCSGGLFARQLGLDARQREQIIAGVAPRDLGLM